LSVCIYVSYYLERLSSNTTLPKHFDQSDLVTSSTLKKN
jgi:hypothetical protein